MGDLVYFKLLSSLPIDATHTPKRCVGFIAAACHSLTPPLHVSVKPYIPSSSLHHHYVSLNYPRPAEDPEMTNPSAGEHLGCRQRVAGSSIAAQ